MIVYYLIGFVVGIVVQTIVNLIIRKITSTTGVLTIDQSDPETDKFDIAVDCLDELYNKKTLELFIVKKSDNASK